MKKNDLFILIGPTAIGKTALSIRLAKEFNGEIISADSMQIYKLMDIGTAKIRKSEMDCVPHHMLNVVYPDEDFSVADYKLRAEGLINDINQRGRLPIIAGGTGLYVNSLVYNLNFTQVEGDEALRKELEEFTNEELFERLKEVDPISSETIKLGDKKRIIRAIEIYELTGKPMSEQNKDFREYNDDYNLAMVGLNMDRQKLYERINLRVDLMVKEGLIEEVSSLLTMGYSKDLVSMQGIGYKEIVEYLEGRESLDRALEILKQKSRNYAKRQLTWFRRDERIKWFNIDEYDDMDLLVKDIVKYKEEIIR